MKKCIRPQQKCNFKFKEPTGEYTCTIMGKNDYYCLDAEVYMTEVIDMQEKVKKRGIKESKNVEDVIKVLTNYLDFCPDPHALDRLSDAIKELRKARLAIMNHYGVDVEDLRS